MPTPPTSAPLLDGQDPILAACFAATGQTYEQGITRLCQQVKELLESVPPVKRTRTRIVRPTSNHLDGSLPS